VPRDELPEVVLTGHAAQRIEPAFSKTAALGSAGIFYHSAQVRRGD